MKRAPSIKRLMEAFNIDAKCAGPYDVLARPHDSGELDRYIAEFDKQTRQRYADDITVQG